MFRFLELLYLANDIKCYVVPQGGAYICNDIACVDWDTGEHGAYYSFVVVCTVAAIVDSAILKVAIMVSAAVVVAVISTRSTWHIPCTQIKQIR